MIGQLLTKVFGRHVSMVSGFLGRSASTSKNTFRRFAIEPLETRRLLAVTGSISGFALLPNNAGVPGLTIQLQSVGSTGALSEKFDLLAAR